MWLQGTGFGVGGTGVFVGAGVLVGSGSVGNGVLVGAGGGCMDVGTEVGGTTVGTFPEAA